MTDDMHGNCYECGCPGECLHAHEAERLRGVLRQVADRLMHEEDCLIFERRKKDRRCDCWLVDVLPLLAEVKDDQ